MISDLPGGYFVYHVYRGRNCIWWSPSPARDRFWSVGELDCPVSRRLTFRYYHEERACEDAWDVSTDLSVAVKLDQIFDLISKSSSDRKMAKMTLK